MFYFHVRSEQRSNCNITLIDPSIKYKKTLGDRSFTAAAPKVWNSLPDFLRNQTIFSKSGQDNRKENEGNSGLQKKANEVWKNLNSEVEEYREMADDTNENLILRSASQGQNE